LTRLLDSCGAIAEEYGIGKTFRIVFPIPAPKLFDLLIRPICLAKENDL
jgi:hypothetical protein